MFSPLFFVQLAHATMAMRVAIRRAACLQAAGIAAYSVPRSPRTPHRGIRKQKTRAFASGSRT